MPTFPNPSFYVSGSYSVPGYQLQFLAGGSPGPDATSCTTTISSGTQALSLSGTAYINANGEYELNLTTTSPNEVTVEGTVQYWKGEVNWSKPFKVTVPPASFSLVSVKKKK